MFSRKHYDPMTFELWYHGNHEDLEQEFASLAASERAPQDCDECNGEGHLECNLEHDHECGECEGTGQIAMTLWNYAMDEFRTQVSRDKVRLADYNAFMKEHCA